MLHEIDRLEILKLAFKSSQRGGIVAVDWRFLYTIDHKNTSIIKGRRAKSLNKLVLSTVDFQVYQRQLTEDLV